MNRIRFAFLGLVSLFLSNILTSQDIGSNTVTIIPDIVPSNIEIGNPGRGFYKANEWAFLSNLPLFDIYERFSWRQLEVDKGIYDFSIIDNQLKSLKKGQRFSFRIMALNTCCTPYKDGTDVPKYVVEEGRGWYYPFHSVYNSDSVFVPDWNDSILIGYMSNILAALAEKYDNDPRIGWFETSFYGNWSEWHTYPLQYPDSTGKYQNPPPNSTYLYAPYIKGNSKKNQPKFRDGTKESKLKILSANTNTFKKTQLIQSTSDLDALFASLQLKRDIPIGIRRDSWGDPNFNDITKWNSYKPNQQEWDLFNNRWKTAPFYAENWGDKFLGEATMIKQLEYFHISAVAFGNMGNWQNMSIDKQQSYLSCARRTGYKYSISEISAILNESVLSTSLVFENSGIAPTYNNWELLTYLINPKTGVYYSLIDTFSLDLKTLWNENALPLKVTNQLQLLTGWESQELLQFRVKLIDTSDFLLPLRLDLQSINLDTSYTLFQIKEKTVYSSVEAKAPNKINLYPNPVRENLSIQNQQKLYNFFKIYDYQGKMCQSGRISKHQNLTTIDIRCLKSGQYVIQLYSEFDFNYGYFTVYK